LHSKKNKSINNAMAKAEWRPIYEFGDKQLTRITADVRRRNEFIDQLAPLRKVNEFLSEAAEKAGRRVVKVSVERGDLANVERMATDLSDTERLIVAQACLASQAMNELRSIDYGTNLSWGGERALIEITHPGVHKQWGYMNFKLRPEKIHTDTQLDEGTQLQGKISGFSTSPALGGAISFRNALGTTHVYGLVHPITAEPRVNLSMLARSH
jgi:hypothetical protein